MLSVVPLDEATIRWVVLHIQESCDLDKLNEVLLIAETFRGESTGEDLSPEWSCAFPSDLRNIHCPLDQERDSCPSPELLFSRRARRHLFSAVVATKRQE